MTAMWLCFDLQINALKKTAWCAWEKRPESLCPVATGVCVGTAPPESSVILAPAHYVDMISEIHEWAGDVFRNLWSCWLTVKYKSPFIAVALIIHWLGKVGIWPECYFLLKMVNNCTMYNNERIKQFYYYNICIYVCMYIKLFQFFCENSPCKMWKMVV